MINPYFLKIFIKIGVKLKESISEKKKLLSNSVPTKSKKNKFEYVTFLIMLTKENVRIKFESVAEK